MRTDTDTVSATQKARLDALYRQGATEAPSLQLDARVMAMAIDRTEIRRERTRKTDRPKEHKPYIISTAASLLFLGLLVVFYPELVPLGRQLVAPGSLVSGAQVAGQKDAGLAPGATRAVAFEPVPHSAPAGLVRDPVEMGLQALDVAIRQGDKPLFDRLFAAFELKGYALSHDQQLRLDELKRRASAQNK